LFGKRTMELTAKTQLIHGWAPTKAPLWRAAPKPGQEELT
jgi:hypothetical protein